MSAVVVSAFTAAPAIFNGVAEPGAIECALSPDAMEACVVGASVVDEPFDIFVPTESSATGIVGNTAIAAITGTVVEMTVGFVAATAGFTSFLEFLSLPGEFLTAEPLNDPATDVSELDEPSADISSEDLTEPVSSAAGLTTSDCGLLLIDGLETRPSDPLVTGTFEAELEGCAASVSGFAGLPCDACVAAGFDGCEDGEAV